MRPLFERAGMGTGLRKSRPEGNWDGFQYLEEVLLRGGQAGHVSFETRDEPAMFSTDGRRCQPLLERARIAIRRNLQPKPRGHAGVGSTSVVLLTQLSRPARGRRWSPPTAAPLGVPLLGVGVGPVVGLFIVSAVPICARRNSGLTSAPRRAQTNR